MPSTNDHEHHTPDALDDLSTLSSSSANSQSTCTNDIYANEDEEEDFDDGEVSASKQLGGGNRLVNLVDLDKALTSIACCQKCSEKSQTAVIDAFINFCEGKTEKIFSSCQPLTQYNERRLRNISVRQFYNEWKDRPVSRMNTIPLSITESSNGLATMISFQCLQCSEEDEEEYQKAVFIKPLKRKIDMEKTKSDLCLYDINIRFCLALQLMGVGGQHASILTTFLDLPEPHKWPRQFSLIERF
jgi:hypothetical protein